MPGTDVTQLSLSDVSELVRSKQISPVELTRECLDRIERLDTKLNSFITVTAESVLAEAHQAEVEIQQGHWRGPLHGIPIALKDIIDTAGVRTTAGSELFNNRIPQKDAEVVRRLKQAGALFLGKLNMHEFAYGGSSVVGHFGPVRNPWKLDYSTGGSSGGSAAAVAAQLCYASIGSDTGGSIRQPAAYCGIIGFKPTYGRVSTTGVIPLSSSLDHIGPMTRTVRDATLVFQAVSDNGTGAADAVTSDEYNLEDATSWLRVGIPRAYFYDGLEAEIEAAMETALNVMAKLTKRQYEISPLTRDHTYSSLMDAYGIIFRAEAYAYHKEFVSKNAELYQPATLKRIQAGAAVTSSQYAQSRRQMEEIRRSIKAVFEEIDFLITPTTCVLPFTIADLVADADTLRSKELLMLRNTRPFNILGLPTISVPCGFTHAGLPIGLQISGPPDGDDIVLRIAHAYEQATEWHKARPSVS